MGTSSSYSAPTGGDWTKLKRRATSYAHNAGHGSVVPATLVATFIAALGGARQAARDSAGATTAGQAIGALISDVSRDGFRSTLAERNLEQFIGASASEVLARLLDLFSTSTDNLDQSAARRAVEEVENEILEHCESFDDLEAEFEKLVDPGALAELLSSFIAAYVFYRLLEVIKERLRDGSSSRSVAQRLERELREYIKDQVHIELTGIDISGFDWRGEDGQQLISRLLRDALTIMQADD